MTMHFTSTECRTNLCASRTITQRRCRCYKLPCSLIFISMSCLPFMLSLSHNKFLLFSNSPKYFLPTLVFSSFCHIIPYSANSVNKRLLFSRRQKPSSSTFPSFSFYFKLLVNKIFTVQPINFHRSTVVTVFHLVPHEFPPIIEQNSMRLRLILMFVEVVKDVLVLCAVRDARWVSCFCCPRHFKKHL